MEFLSVSRPELEQLAVRALRQALENQPNVWLVHSAGDDEEILVYLNPWPEDTETSEPVARVDYKGLEDIIAGCGGRLAFEIRYIDVVPELCNRETERAPVEEAGGRILRLAECVNEASPGRTAIFNGLIVNCEPSEEFAQKEQKIRSTVVRLRFRRGGDLASKQEYARGLKAFIDNHGGSDRVGEFPITTVILDWEDEDDTDNTAPTTATQDREDQDDTDNIQPTTGTLPRIMLEAANRLGLAVIYLEQAAETHLQVPADEASLQAAMVADPQELVSFAGTDWSFTPNYDGWGGLYYSDCGDEDEPTEPYLEISAELPAQEDVSKGLRAAIVFVLEQSRAQWDALQQNRQEILLQCWYVGQRDDAPTEPRGKLCYSATPAEKSSIYIEYCYDPRWGTRRMGKVVSGVSLKAFTLSGCCPSHTERLESRWIKGKPKSAVLQPLLS